MKNRCMPFGYEIRDGKVSYSEAEYNAVKDIFINYLSGMSFQAIADHLTSTGPRYCEDAESWNKSMVKRIIENRRYTGDGFYPPIIDELIYEKAYSVKVDKSYMISPLALELSRTVKDKIYCPVCGNGVKRVQYGNSKYRRKYWRCVNKECELSGLKVDDEMLLGLLLEKLNTLNGTDIAESEPEHEEMSIESIQLTNQIFTLIERGEPDREIIKNMIFQCARQKYDDLEDNTAYLGEVIKKRLSDIKPMTQLDEDFIRNTVDRIYLSMNEVNILLLSGKRI